MKNFEYKVSIGLVIPGQVVTNYTYSGTGRSYSDCHEQAWRVVDLVKDVMYTLKGDVIDYQLEVKRKEKA